MLAPFAVTRLLLILVGLMALSGLPLGPDAARSSASSNPFVSMWSRWDAGWYLSIAQHGYSFQPGQQSNVAFFPLYPLLMWVGGFVLGRETEQLAIAGIIVSNVALVVGLTYLVRLVREDFDEGVATRTSLYILSFPSTLFLSAVYPESLILALTVASLYYAHSGAWWRAGLLGGLAAAARPYGVLLVAPLALEYLTQFRQKRRPLRAHHAVALALVPAGLVAWTGYLFMRFGNPLVFAEAQQYWARTFWPPWGALRPYYHGQFVLLGEDGSLLELLFTFGYAVLVVACWRLVRPPYALLATMVLLVIVLNGQLNSSIRFGIELFPLFIVLAVAGRRGWVHSTYLVVGSGLATIFMALFSLVYPGA